MIVQARGAFTLGGTELGRSCISGYHDMRVGSREGHTWRESSRPALYNGMLVNDWYTAHISMSESYLFIMFTIFGSTTKALNEI